MSTSTDTREHLHNRELSLRSASFEFRDLPNWTEKLKDRSFVVNWLRQRQQADFEQHDDVNDPYLKPLVWGRDDVTMWFNELAGCVEGGGFVDEGVGKRSIDGAAILESVPEDQKPWPPSQNSDKMVLDLLGPSAWPITYRQTTTVNGFTIQTTAGYHQDLKSQKMEKQKQNDNYGLIDKSKPGYTKMLIFHYRDPCQLHNLPTTKQIHPQQPHTFEDKLRNSKLGTLPEEVFSQIFEYLSISTIPFGEAKEHLNAMNEWKES
ncbi:uncharacterized protein DFL_006357 [Arthrobotrys flagrans]|uniref:F-box domain-containing protein n=1 Tax=Arthrobotrys flagrans TaxID=97331 RepID=A0A437A036_ARTFL|nr:hypothetical protein DFL_006357 [Arthrobotrys flagrans]